MTSPNPKIDIAALAAIFPPESDYSRNYGWAAIAASIFLGFGQEKLVEDLVHGILEQTGDDVMAQTTAFRKVREAMLKASALVGFPRSINGLALLQSTLQVSAPQCLEVLHTDKSLRAPIPLPERHTRGHAFFSKIYGKHTSTVLSNLNATSGGDLGEYAVNCVYGDLVAEFSILSEKETGLLEFVCCLSIMAGPQAKGHFFGSRTLGNTGREIGAATEMTEGIAREMGVRWERTGMEWLDKAKGW